MSVIFRFCAEDLPVKFAIHKQRVHKQDFFVFLPRRVSGKILLTKEAYQGLSSQGLFGQNR